jgi:hypothetical protein
LFLTDCLVKLFFLNDTFFTCFSLLGPARQDFTCDCSNAWFIQWVTTETKHRLLMPMTLPVTAAMLVYPVGDNRNQTQVVDAYDFTCDCSNACLSSG